MPNLKFLRQFDSRPSQFSLNFSRHMEYKSEVGGLISLACKLMLVGFLVLKSWQLISRQSPPTYSMKVIKQNDMNELEFNDADIKIQIQTVDNTNNDTKHLSLFDLPVYGLEASYATHQVCDGPTPQGDYELDMVTCQNSRSWICIPGAAANQTVIGNNQFVYSHEKGCILRKKSIIISKCEKGQLINGKPCQQINPNRLFKFLIVLKNKDINPQQVQEIDLIKSQQKHRIIQTHHLLSSNYSIYFTIFLNRVTISTDNSIMPTILSAQPQFHNVTSWFYDELKNQQLVLEGDKDTLLKIDIKRSIYTHQYYRKYQRVDAMLGQVLGLIGLVSIFLFFFYQGYNDWCLQQIVRQQLGFSYSRISLLNYYKWRVGWLGSKMCCCLTGRNQNRINKSRQWQQIIERLDYLQVLKTMEYVKQKKGVVVESQLYMKQENRKERIGTNIQMSGAINIEDNEGENRNTDMGRTMYTIDQPGSYADRKEELRQTLISYHH